MKLEQKMIEGDALTSTGGDDLVLGSALFLLSSDEGNVVSTANNICTPERLCTTSDMDTFKYR